MQSSLGERREEKVRARQAPDHGPFRPRRDSCRKKSGRRTVESSGSSSSEFVESTVSETATRQDAVDLRHTERKTASLFRALTFYGRDAFAQISKDMFPQDSRHRSLNPSGSRWWEKTASCRPECLMFFFCSFIRTESSRSKIGIQSHSVSDSADFLFESAC
jgi:hypothetical protein